MNSSNYTKNDVVFGIHPVAEVLSAGRRPVYKIFIKRGKTGRPVNEIIEHARSLDIPVEQKTGREITELAQNPHHQDIAASTGPYPLIRFKQMLDRAGSYEDELFFLIIDSVADPQNLGALVRSAVCTGISGIIVPKDRSAPPTAAVSRASAGALEHAGICVVTNLANTMKDLKKNHFWITGLDQQGQQLIYETDMTGTCALVIGGENTGIRPLVKRHCDFLCRIPQTGPINSLNASVAGGIALYEAMRQRIQKTKKTL